MFWEKIDESNFFWKIRGVEYYNSAFKDAALVIYNILQAEAEKKCSVTLRMHQILFTGALPRIPLG